MNMTYTVVQTDFQMMFKNCMNVQGRSSQGHMQMGIYYILQCRQKLTFMKFIKKTLTFYFKMDILKMIYTID